MFAPRAGLAYRATEKTVFRAGFGITNDPYPLSRPIRSPYPAVIVDEYVQLNSFVPAGTLSTGIPAVRFPDISSGVLDIPNTVATNSLQAGEFRRGYIESFNFTIQRELGLGFVLTTSYVGTRSIRQALTYYEINAGLVPGAGANGRPLFQKFGVNVNRSMFIPMATNRYDAWQSNLQKRFSHGLFLTTSYTWAKTMGITAGNSDNGLRFYVASQYSKNRAVSDFDRTHTFTTAANWELPFGRNKSMLQSGVGSAILGGWQLNPTIAFYTGTPFIVGTDGASLNAPQNTQVADQIRADVTRLGGVGVGAPFYDPTAFASVSAARFGNMGLNALRGPNLFNMNLGLFRRFDITEAVNLQFRAEGLNVTNTPTLSNPNATVTSPANFMMITSTIAAATTPQRTLRFGLRLAF
jgi:hypothetical protein